MATVVNVTSTAQNRAYAAGEMIGLTVTFDQAVTVSGGPGLPFLQLATNNGTRYATYVDGTGTTSLNFNYAVGPGDNTSDLDYAGTGALLPSDASIMSGGIAASLVLPVPGAAGSLGANKDIVIDGVAPTVVISSDKTSLAIGQQADLTFTFSEDPGDTFTWSGSSGDVVVTGGTVTAISGSGLIRTAKYTPSAGVDGGTASIKVAAASYADAAGNPGGAGVTPSITFDTRAPAAPATPDLIAASDAGTQATDDLTSVAMPTFAGAAGSAEAGATIRVYAGSTQIASTTATGSGSWQATSTVALADGAQSITATATDALGNVSGSSPNLTVTIDTQAPTLTITSDVAALNGGDTATVTFTFSEDPELGFTAGDISVAGGVFGPLSGAGLTRTAVFTPTANVNAGSSTVSVGAGSYRDRAGNGGGGGSLTLTYDTLAPSAPVAPTLAAPSDTGILGDGRTTSTVPVIQGVAVADAAIVLYDGVTEIGKTTADKSGNWQVTAALALGVHTLTATQADAAGNVSTASPTFALTIETVSSVPADPTTIIDGTPVQTSTVTLPGGIPGLSVSIPVVGAGRPDTGGVPNLADIPLFSAGSANLLLAQLPQGFGLSASGANVNRATGLDLLTATIKAATPGHTPDDQGQQVGHGQAFLSPLAADNSVLVMTVAPTSVSSAGTLTLSGAAAPAGQRVAVVIDTRGLAADTRLDLLDLDFAVMVGKGDVNLRGGGMILSGDAAAQHITVAAGRGDTVFAGGGNDRVSVDLSPTALGTRGTTLLHGGQGSDVVQFSGVRSDYDIEQHNGHVVVVSKADPALRSVVINAEQLQFGDATIDVANGAGLSTLAGLYQSVLGRQADVGGIEFWANGRDAGASWGSIAVGFINSTERLGANAGFDGNAEHDVTLLFDALFHRAPDAQGLAFWSTALKNGASLAQVANGFVESVEMVGHQLAATDWDFRA
jgi:hypothetical protein